MANNFLKTYGLIEGQNHANYQVLQQSPCLIGIGPPTLVAGGFAEVVDHLLLLFAGQLLSGGKRLRLCCVFRAFKLIIFVIRLLVCHGDKIGALLAKEELVSQLAQRLDICGDSLLELLSLLFCVS